MSSLWLLRRNSPRRGDEPRQQHPSFVEARPRRKKLRHLSLSRLSPRKLLEQSPLSPSSAASSKRSSPRGGGGRSSFNMSSVKTDNITLHWMSDGCPTDLLPKILSFAGPQAMASLGNTCKAWRNVMRTEAVWRTLCEDQYKVSVVKWNGV